MGMYKIYVFILIVFITFVGCTAKELQKENSTNILDISKKQESLIFEYLDTKTNDIAYSKEGNMFSAFKILGTDKDKVYIWLVKVGYSKSYDNKDINKTREGVYIPICLSVKEDEIGFLIIRHEFPRDGLYYGKDIIKIFPPNIVNEINSISKNTQIQLELVEATEIRAKEKLKLQ